MWIKFNTEFGIQYLDFSRVSLISIKEEKDLFVVNAFEAGTEYNWTIATYSTRELAEKFVDYFLFVSIRGLMASEVFTFPTEEELLMKWKESIK